MPAFADTARITIGSGKGGDGHVSFRRELYVPNGGPDGGDGGDGGDLIFEVDYGLNTLSSFRMKKKYLAEDGEEGGGKRCHGRNGRDLVIKVPYGTLVREAYSGRVITDMSGDNLREVVLKGGKGGLGNMHFATSVMQAPRYAKPGAEGIRLDVSLELKLIADVGLVGFPNVGKSTIISMCSNAKPEIANYHFTTLTPHLGVVDLGEDRSFVMADIPGLIEGASEGLGLGHDFLRHVERCRLIVHVVDAAGTEGRDPLDDILRINEELSKFNPSLMDLPVIIAANKMDAFVPGEGRENPIERIAAVYEPQGIRVIPMSAATGEGVRELVYAISSLLETLPKETRVYEKEYDVSEARPSAEGMRVFREAPHRYRVEGEKIMKMLGYTNLDDDKGMSFFQKYMKDCGAIDEMKKLGLEESDTVIVGGMEFEYYE